MRIGISGAIGTGKSTAAEYLSQKYNIALYDADKYGHRLYSVFSPSFYQILKNFGTINRAKIAGIVFSDQNKLQILNRITHPAIFKMISKEIEGEAIIEATLLHQIGLDRLTDINVLLVSSDKVINNRLRERGYQKDQLINRKRSMPKFNPKDFDIIIENNDSLKELYTKLDRSLSKYFKK